MTNPFPDNVNSDDQSRQSMWSVRPTWVSPYFILFTLQVIAGEAVIIWHELSRATQDTPFETFIGIIQGIGWVGLAAAVNTFAITEALEGIMVTAMWFRHKFLEPLKERQRAEWRAEALAEGREEGREELIAEINEWEQRRRDAKTRGEPFDEPPPYLQNGHHQD